MSGWAPLLGSFGIGGTSAWALGLVVFFLAGFGAWLILAVLLKTGWAWDIATDVPNHRSLHSRPTPRVGGLGLLPASLLTGAAMAPTFRLAALVALAIALVSQIDDRRGLPARVRFAAQLLGALVFLGVGSAFGPAHAALAAAVGASPFGAGVVLLISVFLVIAFVWSMNLYNFMDGTDGLAGGMACIGFGCYAFAAFFAMHHSGGRLDASSLSDAGLPHFVALRDIALASCAVAGAAVGFLYWNLPPARLFMGDAGSVPLGFLAAALGWLGWAHGAWPALFPFMVFSPFAADATVTLLRRLMRGERFWEAHREHYYQRMVRMGWSRVRVLSICYGAMLCIGVCALCYTFVPTSHIASGVDVPLCRAMLAAFCCLGIVGLGAFVDRRWSRYMRTVEMK